MTQYEAKMEAIEEFRKNSETLLQLVSDLFDGVKPESVEPKKVRQRRVAGK